MVIEEVLNNSPEVLTSLVSEAGKVALWLQAIGLLVIFWIVTGIITLIMNRKKRKAIYQIKNDLKRIEGKIDRLSKK